MADSPQLAALPAAAPPAPAPALADLCPMEAARDAAPFTDAAWAFQLQPRGSQRVLVELGGDAGVRLHSRRHVDITAWFPEVAQALAGWPAGRAVLDAELCVFDDAGRNEPQRLRERCLVRGHADGTPPAGLLVRDLLVHDGQDVRSEGWAQRRRLLHAMHFDGQRVRRATAVEGDGHWLCRQAQALGRADVLALHLHAPYEGGPSPHCLRIRAQEAGADQGAGAP